MGMTYPSFLNGLLPQEKTPCFGRGDIFISKNGNFSRARAAAARKLCWQCPVRQECATWAVENGEKNGIWGGFTPHERARFYMDERLSVRRTEKYDCGTESAWRAHLSLGESCCICRFEHDARLRNGRLERLEREHNEHGGSLAGYRLEILLGMPTCSQCRKARQKYYLERSTVEQQDDQNDQQNPE